MNEEIKNAVSAQKSRRAFLKTAGQVAVTAPAAVVLLNAGAINPAAAQVYIGPTGDGTVIADDALADRCVSGPGFIDSASVHPVDCAP